MFTGIIEYVGTVQSIGGGKVCVEIAPFAQEIALGDSVAVNGVCLTAVKVTGSNVDFDVSPETISRSTLSSSGAGKKVNIERAMPADGRFGGHIVQGHVDGTGKLTRITRKGQFAEYTFTAEPEILDQMVEKGSVAMDGISLTIARMQGNTFTIALIPETLKKTTWNELREQMTVNIETDIVCKVIQKQLKKLSTNGGLTLEKLRECGF